MISAIREHKSEKTEKAMEYSKEKIEALVREVVTKIKAEGSVPAIAQEHDGTVPVGISNRHVHLSREDLDTLFGAGYELTPMKDLSQPGQYAAKELVTIVGPSLRPIENVRVLGPIRKSSQVEISRTDSFVLKVKPPVRESGDIKGSSPITVIGPKGAVVLREGCIIANRHIHMSTEEARAFGVSDGEYVDVMADGERPARLLSVQVRANDAFRLEMHVDTDDANAVGLKNGSRVKIIKR